MSIPRFSMALGLLAAAAVVSSAGSQPEHDAESGAAAGAGREMPEVAQPARVKRTERASPGKPRAPIAISHELSGEAQVGQALDVRITARASAGIGGLSLELTSDDALLIGPFAPEGAAGATADERVWTVSVTPLQAVSTYLNVFVKVRLGDQEQVRSVMIPIRAGDAKAATESADALKTDESGEAIIALPAEETP